VKWIGNDGSHTAALPLKDVLEGVALLERALHLVYDRTAEELDQLADEINLRNRNRGQQTAPTSTSQARDK
jgi:hypothetical protein